MAKEPTETDSPSTHPLCPVWEEDPDSQDGFLGFSADEVEESAALLNRYEQLVDGSEGESPEPVPIPIPPPQTPTFTH